MKRLFCGGLAGAAGGGALGGAAADGGNGTGGRFCQERKTQSIIVSCFRVQMLTFLTPLQKHKFQVEGKKVTNMFYLIHYIKWKI